MSSLRFPAIDSKKSITQDQDYNFVNKNKKSKGSSNTGSALEMIEELKRKIDEQKKEIENRNITIQGLQRNFESLSVIVKNEKSQSAALRSELETLKSNYHNGDKRAEEYHEKFLQQQNQNKNLRDQLKSLKKTHADCALMNTVNEQLRSNIAEIKLINEKLHARIINMDKDKKALETELGHLKEVEKQKRLLKQRLTQLQEESRKAIDKGNGLAVRLQILEAELTKTRNELGKGEKKSVQDSLKIKEVEKRKSIIEEEAQRLQRENGQLKTSLDELTARLDSKDVSSKVKFEDEERLRRQIKQLQQQLNEIKELQAASAKECGQKEKMLGIAHSEIDYLRKEVEGAQVKAGRLQEDSKELNKSLSELQANLDLVAGHRKTLGDRLLQEQNQKSDYASKMGKLQGELQHMSQQMNEYHGRFGHYISLIVQNEPNVIITNEREMAKMENNSVSSLNQFKIQLTRLQNANDELCQQVQMANKRNIDLEQEIAKKEVDLQEKDKIITKYSAEEEALSRMIQEQRRTAEEISREARETLQVKIQQFEDEKSKAQRQVSMERAKREEQLRQKESKLREEQAIAEEARRSLETFKVQEEQLKQMMNREQEQMRRLAKEKEEEISRMIKEKESDIEKQRVNNKLLWSDNKKLKDMEAKMKEEAERQLQEQENNKREEIERLRKQLERKYNDDVSSLKEEESSAGELKRLLLDKANQMKNAMQSNSQLKNEVEFYKSRNKELEGVVSRLEKQYKANLAQMERNLKAKQQLAEISERRLKDTVDKLKDAGDKLGEQETRHKKEIKLLYLEIDQLKEKWQSHKMEEKLALICKSVADLDTSLQALANTLSCNYCIEVVKDCVRLQCGHIYCRKCKAGYDPSCGQCQKKGTAVPDKRIDDSVSKAQYMRLLLVTIREDIVKIGQR